MADSRCILTCNRLIPLLFTPFGESPDTLMNLIVIDVLKDEECPVKRRHVVLEDAYIQRRDSSELPVYLHEDRSTHYRLC